MNVVVSNNFLSGKNLQTKTVTDNSDLNCLNSKYKIFTPLATDAICFTGTACLLKQEKIGAGLDFAAKKWETEIFKKLPFLKTKKTFETKEYQELSKTEKTYLDEILERVYNTEEPFYKCPQELRNRTIKRDFTDLIKASNCLKASLDKKYKNGYVLVAVGGSPSIFAKILEHQGIETKILPFSKENLEQNLSKIDFKKYFAKFGLTEDYVKNSKKQIVFVDYVSTHETFNVFNRILEQNNLKSKNTSLESIWSLFAQTPTKTFKENKINPGFFGFFEQFFFNNRGIKAYRPCPKINDGKNVDFYNNIENINKTFHWDLTTKLMNFSIIDYYAKLGLTKTIK